MSAVKAVGQIDIVDVTDAYNVILTSEAHTFPGTTSAAVAGSTTTQIIAMRGATQIAASVDLSAVTTPTGVTVAKDTDATEPTLTITVSTAVTTAGTVTIPVYIADGDVTINKVFSFAIAFVGAAGGTGAKGDTGATGATGKGISSSAITYQASSSGTTAPTGTWTTTIPSVSASQYLWTKTVITYSDSTSSTLYSVGMMGATGPTGAKGSTGATGAAGADALSLVVTSSAGTIFKNSSIVTTFTAHVFKGATELTSSTTPTLASQGTINWYKDGATTAVGTGQTLSISAGTVTSKASYVAKLEG